MFEKYYRLNKVAGVNIDINKYGIASFNACLLNVDGNNLTISQKIVSAANVNDLKKQLPDKTVVAVTLVGKGILTKQVDKRDSENSLDFSNVLPNANADDFYIQNFVSGERSFVSLIRKQDADKWVEHLRNIGLVPVTLGLGPFVINQIIPQLNAYDQEIIFHGHIIQRTEQNHWSAYKYNEAALSPFPYKIESEKIDETLLIPYASAFQLALYPNIALISADAAPLHVELKRVIDTVKFRVNGVAILSSMFVLLLLNFLLFSYYTSKNSSLAARVGQSTVDAGKTQLLSDSIKIKKELLEVLGWEGRTDKSVLIDQIAQLLPPDVKWQQLVINPIAPATNHEDTKDHFAVRQLKITGMSERLIPVNEWMARLKTKPWIKSIQLQNYYFNNELNTGQFVILIMY